MPKNKGKGGKNRRRGKNENEETKRQLEFKEPGQEYSQVVRMLGNGRCECYCFDGGEPWVILCGMLYSRNQIRHRAAMASMVVEDDVAFPYGAVKCAANKSLGLRWATSYGSRRAILCLLS